MRKGQKRYRNQVVSFFPTNDRLLYDNEIFVELTDKCIPGVYDYYLISNYGRVFNKYSNNFLSIQIGSDGYYCVTLSGSFGNKNIRINRLVMMAFYPIDNYNDLVVNHLDGNPKNNYIDNLELATRSRNSKHAYEIGLMKKGEEHQTAIISNKTATEICKLLETNMTFEQIANTVGNGTTTTIVQGIFQRKTWVDLSKSYNFRKSRKRYMFNEDEVRTMCKYFEDNPFNCNKDTKYSYCRRMLEEFEYFNKDNSTDSILHNAVGIFSRISYTYISNEYTF